MFNWSLDKLRDILFRVYGAGVFPSFILLNCIQTQWAFPEVEGIISGLGWLFLLVFLELLYMVCSLMWPLIWVVLPLASIGARPLFQDHSSWEVIFPLGIFCGGLLILRNLTLKDICSGSHSYSHECAPYVKQGDFEIGWRPFQDLMEEGKEPSRSE